MIAIIEGQDDGRNRPSHWYQVSIGRGDPAYYMQSELAEAIAYAKKRAEKVFINGEEVA